MSNALNVGKDFGEATRLVVYWHNQWSKENIRAKKLQTAIDLVKSPGDAQDNAIDYGKLSNENKIKIDKLMDSLLAIDTNII